MLHNETKLKQPHFRKRQLEICLSQLDKHPNPKLQYEAYALDSGSAAQFLHIAGHIFNDIGRKTIVDLGCGTGILSIGALIIGARNVIGIDIDRESIQTAVHNAQKMGVKLDLIVGNIQILHSHGFDTALMNPPFGSWHRGADITFLEKALEISSKVYSLHKRSSSSRRYISRTVKKLGGVVDQIFELHIALRPTFAFHRHTKYYVATDLYRILCDRLL